MGSHNELGWILVCDPIPPVFAVVFLLQSVDKFTSFVHVVCIIVHEVFLDVFLFRLAYVVYQCTDSFHGKLPFVYLTLFSLLNVKVLIKGKNVSMLGFNFSLCTVTLGIPIDITSHVQILANVQINEFMLE